jgi:hypothetical protein
MQWTVILNLLYYYNYQIDSVYGSDDNIKMKPCFVGLMNIIDGCKFLLFVWTPCYECNGWLY